jgi:hypothetical protein
MMHRWSNVKTGESIDATVSEFDDRFCNGVQRGQDIRKTGCTTRSGWRYERQVYTVIQGDAVKWLTTGKVRGTPESAQYKEKISAAWDKWVLIAAMYHSGRGCKAIGRKLGLTSATVLSVLREGGVDTSARRNYALPNGTKTLKQSSREYYLRDVSSPEGRLKRRVMSRIWSAMKRQTVNARGTFSAVGCSIQELRAHIEKQFTPGMTWANYGEWHVDHIRPCASFDLSDPEQFSACFNWSNLQPLWAAENLSKSDTYAQS